MLDKEPNSLGLVQWLLLLLISIWGGVVRYIIDIKTKNRPWNWLSALMQILISGFTGLLGGLLSIDLNQSLYLTLFTTGVCGAMGSIVLSYFWQRLIGGRHV